DAVVVDAAAVVLDFDIDVVAAMVRAKRNAAGFGFAGERAAVRRLDAVRDGIAHEVDERIGNLLNDVVVEFGFAAEEFEFDELAGGLSSVTHGSGKARIQCADWQHAGGGDFVLQVVSELGELVDIALDAANETAELRKDFVHVGRNLGHG